MTESVESPERIWIESDEGGCPYFYHENELSDVGTPVTEYVRADKLEELAAEIEALRAEIERLAEALRLALKWVEVVPSGEPLHKECKADLAAARAALAQEASND